MDNKISVDAEKIKQEEDRAERKRKRLAKREQARENLKALAAVGDGKIGVEEVAILYGAPSAHIIDTALSDRRLGKPNPRGPNVRPPLKEGTRNKWRYRDVVKDAAKDRGSREV